MQLLNSDAAQALGALIKSFEDDTVLLTERSLNLDKLAEQIQRRNHLADNIGSFEQQFVNIESQFELLERFDFSVPEEQLLNLKKLRPDFAEFEELVHSSKKRLELVKRDMKSDLETALDTWNAGSVALLKTSKKGMPFQGSLDTDAAFKRIADYEKKVEDMRAEERALAPGLAIFEEIEVEDQKELKVREAIYNVYRLSARSSVSQANLTLVQRRPWSGTSKS